jgi:hypothetical protein
MSDAPSSLPSSDATTMGTSMEGVEVKVLELFAGTGSVGSFVNRVQRCSSHQLSSRARF